jgi:hypothetical protein
VECQGLGGDPLHPAPLTHLPTKAASPRRTHALIVGIERYAASPQWDLDGPLHDALAIRDWLLSRGVPKDQIYLHVSPLEKNRAALAHPLISHMDPTDQALRATIDAIKKKPYDQADLLFFYWAGHGLISKDQQCLLLADATNADMQSYAVDNHEGSLCTSFANEHCAGFAQQIFLFDTCRSIHRQPASPPPVKPLPTGQPLAKSQFLFFASQKGQAATNLGQERHGLFTKVLLEQLQSRQAPENGWPPDMDAIAKAVQQVFADNPSQYPVYKRYRHFSGNEEIDPLPVSGEAASGGAEAPAYLLSSAGQLCQPGALNDDLHRVILNGLGADPRSAWDRLKANLGRTSLDVDLVTIHGKEILFGLRAASLEEEVRQVIDLCCDTDNGLALLDRAFEAFRSSKSRTEARSCLRAYAKILPNQQSGNQI